MVARSPGTGRGCTSRLGRPGSRPTGRAWGPGVGKAWREGWTPPGASLGGHWRTRPLPMTKFPLPVGAIRRPSSAIRAGLRRHPWRIVAPRFGPRGARMGPAWPFVTNRADARAVVWRIACAMRRRRSRPMAPGFRREPPRARSTGAMEAQSGAARRRLEAHGLRPPFATRRQKGASRATRGESVRYQVRHWLVRRLTPSFLRSPRERRPPRTRRSGAPRRGPWRDG